MYSETIHLKNGRSAFNNGDFQLAVEEFSNCIDEDPTCLPAYIGRAYANSECQWLPDTYADYEKVILLAPDSGEAYLARAELELHNGFEADYKLGVENHMQRYPEIIALYSRAIELKPDFPDAFYNKAELEFELDNFSQTLEDYDLAIHCDPLFSFAYIKRAVVKSKLGDYRGAIKDYEFYLGLPIGATHNRNIFISIASCWLKLSRQPVSEMESAK